ncbi:DUF427 domain-containing protein [Roseiconus nitratireducens]|uniref:DUF427 domain-containing protein n=1 Tax=Roseiconus nitratireducens TaxID=2605748 RepID=A0A5M6CWK7_9BACT|nr:DUF427 domain-containing protein [Roseiconus nitratireducens]KAA5539607.1 DUF427 domain-containing protein [Roseiconus nitratireducens]
MEPSKRQGPQESVWDYPRPPRLERTSKTIRVVVDGLTIAETNRAMRMLETSHPPVYYIPPEDMDLRRLRREPGGSFCEWKGPAYYFAIVTPRRVIGRAAWYYPDPPDRYSAMAEYVAFYPSKIDAGYVDGIAVEAQPGDFYGGWITPDIVGPFKGGPGTMGW